MIVVVYDVRQIHCSFSSFVLEDGQVCAQVINDIGINLPVRKVVMHPLRVFFLRTRDDDSFLAVRTINVEIVAGIIDTIVEGGIYWVQRSVKQGRDGGVGDVEDVKGGDALEYEEESYYGE